MEDKNEYYRKKTVELYCDTAVNIVENMNPRRFFEKDIDIWIEFGFKDQIQKLYEDWDKQHEDILKRRDEILKTFEK